MKKKIYFVPFLLMLLFSSSLTFSQGPGEPYFPETANGAKNAYFQYHSLRWQNPIETIYNETQNGTERNYVFVPLFVLSEGLGIYVIYTSKPKNEFTKQDLDVLDIIAEQTAIAIENFRINKKLRDSEKIFRKQKNKFNVFSKKDINI